MKNLFFILITFLLLTSCSNKEKKMLCKRWQVYDVIFMNEKEATVQSDTMQGNMHKVTETILKDILMKNIYEFNSDGTYKTGNAAASATGKWELHGKAIKFILDSDKEEKEKEIPFEKLENDTLIMLMKNDQTSFQMKLILIPMN
ncbi:MAG: hypothetical protein WCO28_11415 [Bacteroidota bacterium]